MVSQAVYNFGVTVHDVEFGIPFNAKGLACSPPKLGQSSPLIFNERNLARRKISGLSRHHISEG
jgi:hypothetical protein